MMKILVSRIREAGETLSLKPSEPWVKEAVVQAYPLENPKLDTVSGFLFIQRVADNVTLTGKVGLVLRPLCDRCGQPFDLKLDLPVTMHLAPSFEDEKVPRTRGQLQSAKPLDFSEEGVDLNFSFYNGVEVDVSDVLRETLVLNLPARFLCRDDCKGLCLNCRTNLNESSCSCSSSVSQSSPWAVLESLKK